ncbi:hypothetical protein ACVOMT_05930 [Sphingomonas panni]
MARKNAATTNTQTEGVPVVTSTSLTSTTVLPAQNPLMQPKNYVELGAFVLMVAALFALVEKRTEKRRKDDASLHQLSHDAVNRELGDIKHDLRGVETKITALDNKRQEADRWGAKVDLTIANIEKGQDRIERDVKEGFNRMEKLILGKHKPGND